MIHSKGLGHSQIPQVYLNFFDEYWKFFSLAPVSLLHFLDPSLNQVSFHSKCDPELVRPVLREPRSHDELIRARKPLSRATFYISRALDLGSSTNELWLLTVTLCLKWVQESQMEPWESLSHWIMHITSLALVAWRKTEEQDDKCCFSWVESEFLEHLFCLETLSEETRTTGPLPFADMAAASFHIWISLPNVKRMFIHIH